jgi:hypothetical protein
MSVSPLVIELLREAYRRFNDRDLEGAIALMSPDVDWPNAMEGGREKGRDEVLAYWTRQMKKIDPHVEPLGFRDLEDGRVAVDVRMVVKDLDGAVTSDRNLVHVYTVRGDVIERMDVEMPAEVK